MSFEIFVDKDVIKAEHTSKNCRLIILKFEVRLLYRNVRMQTIDCSVDKALKGLLPQVDTCLENRHCSAVTN